MKIHKYLIISALLSLSSCKSPKLIGYYSSRFNVTEEKVNTITKEVEAEVLKANYIFQQELIKSIKIDATLIAQLDRDFPIIVSSYSTYPFNHVMGNDTISNKKIYPVDNVILNSVNTELQKQLIASGFKVLESNAIYNLTLDENFDEYNQLVIFNIKDFGMYFQKLNENELSRVGKASVEFRILNKSGVLRSITDKDFSINDNVSQTEMPLINDLGPKLGYISQTGNVNLNITDLPSLGSKDISVISPKDKILKKESVVETIEKTVERVNGIKIQLPKNTKSYDFKIIDYETYLSIMKSSTSLKIPTELLIQFSPATLKVKSTQQENISTASGAIKPMFYAQISINELQKYFKDTREIVLLYKGKKICIVRINEKGEMVYN